MNCDVLLMVSDIDDFGVEFHDFMQIREIFASVFRFYNDYCT